MCKLYIATGPLNTKQVTSAIRAANHAFRSSEKDGFGFLAANGLHVARGRYLTPHTYAGYMTNLPAWLTGASAEENTFPKTTNVLITHGRTSTNTKGLDNVHPFCYRSYYLAHNGMVAWTGKKEDEPKQACDSDQLLHWLVDNNFDWNAAIKFWSGWGAVAAYDRKSGKLTIARDCANLSIARRINQKGWVFATSDKQLVAISKQAGIALDTPPLSFPKHLIDIVSGKIVSERSWEGFGTRQWTVLDSRAKGKSNFAHEFFPDYEPVTKTHKIKITGAED